MDQELAFKILNKRKLVEAKEGQEMPIVVRTKVTHANTDYRNPKNPKQIGILSFALMTNYHLEKASSLIKENELQLALNCQCTKSVFEGEYFPEKGNYVDVSLDFVELKDEETGEITQALMIVGCQPPTITKTSNPAEKLKMLLSGSKFKEEKDTELFTTSKKTSV